jgi:dolichyl-diphosphooligosaccharide--protein glycosyltransferase
MSTMRGALAAITIAIGLVGCSASGSTTPGPSGCPTAAPTADQAATITADAARAVVTTSLGTFSMELYPQAAPIATANFAALARCGFYDGITFHRVLAGFVAQAGDPQTRTNRGDFAGLGSGGPGYHFAIEPPADGYGYDAYVVAMANAARPDTNGSQFFIDLADLNNGLDRTYTIFAKVVDGTDVVDAIGSVTVSDPSTGVPVVPVIIQSIVIQPGA